MTKPRAILIAVGISVMLKLVLLQGCTHAYHATCWSGGKEVINENMYHDPLTGRWYNSDGDLVKMRDLSCQFRRAD